MREVTPQPRHWTCLCSTALSPRSHPWWSLDLKLRMEQTVLSLLINWLRVRKESEGLKMILTMLVWTLLVKLLAAQPHLNYTSGGWCSSLTCGRWWFSLVYLFFHRAKTTGRKIEHQWVIIIIIIIVAIKHELFCFHLFFSVRTVAQGAQHTYSGNFIFTTASCMVIAIIKLLCW